MIKGSHNLQETLFLRAAQPNKLIGWRRKKCEKNPPPLAILIVRRERFIIPATSKGASDKILARLNPGLGVAHVCNRGNFAFARGEMDGINMTSMFALQREEAAHWHRMFLTQPPDTQIRLRFMVECPRHELEERRGQRTRHTIYGLRIDRADGARLADLLEYV